MPFQSKPAHQLDKLMRFLSLLFVVFSITSSNSLAHSTEQHIPPQSPYQGQENRDIKALSANEVEGLKTGKGLGLAKAAELNGLPGPKHVLELKEPLQLSPEQEKEVLMLFSSMKNEAIALGTEVLRKEQELETFFRSDNPSEKDMVELVAEVADVRGKLRVTHLKYHLKTTDVLTKHQTKQYFTLRGYGKNHHGGH